MMNPLWQQFRSQHCINTSLENCPRVPKCTLTARQPFSAAVKTFLRVAFPRLTPTVSQPIDGGWYSLTFISAACEPGVIYAAPLTSLSPSSSPSPFFLHSFLPSFASLCPHATLSSLLTSHPLCLTVLLFFFFSPPLCLPLQSSLSNGDKGRSADYLSNGKKRKADEKEFMTDYVSYFNKRVKC